MVPRVYLDVPTCKYEAIQTSRAVRRVHSVFKLVALRVMSLYNAFGAYWDTYSSNISTWLAWAAASLVRGGFGFSEIVPKKVVKKCCVQLSKPDNLLFLLNLYSETRQHNILTNIYDYTSPPS